MHLLLILLVCLLPVVARADKVALVIGNAAYQNAAELTNPANDAAAVSEALTRQGFRVTRATDLTRADMLDQLRDFRASADAAEIAMVYYAGHGIEIGGRNYLIPVDARVADERDARLEMIELDDVLAQLSGAHRMKMVVLDACRDNPFAARMKAENTGRNIGRGLASVTSAEADTLIAYAAAAGEVTLDGAEGGNSPFTRAFVAALDGPSADVRIVLGQVRDEMRKAVPGAAPFVYSSLGGGSYVINPNSAAPAVAQPQPPSPAPGNAIILDFATAELTDTPEAWSVFLEKYNDQPTHPLVTLASRRLTLAARAPAPVVRTTVAPPPTRTEALRTIQRELAARGCYAGAIDGVIGAQTMRGLGRMASLAGIELGFESGAEAADEDLARVAATLGQLGALRCTATAPTAAPARLPRPQTAPAPAPAAKPQMKTDATGQSVFSNPPNTCPQYGSTPDCLDGSPRRK